MGQILVVLGGAILLIGLVLVYAPFLLSWFGSLPGDIRYNSDNTKVFIPITSMILVSCALSLISWLFRR